MSGTGSTDGGDDDGGKRLPIDHSLLDPVSGLFAQPAFLAVVDLRVVACRRMLRPLALCLFEVVEGLPDGPLKFADPGVVAAMLRTTLRAADVAARTGLDAVAIHEWGVIERVSTGLLCERIGLQPVGRQMLAAADRIAPAKRA